MFFTLAVLFYTIQAKDFVFKWHVLNTIKINSKKEISIRILHINYFVYRFSIAEMYLTNKYSEVYFFIELPFLKEQKSNGGGKLLVKLCLLLRLITPPCICFAKKKKNGSSCFRRHFTRWTRIHYVSFSRKVGWNP